MRPWKIALLSLVKYDRWLSARPKKGQQGHNPKATTFSLFGQIHAHSKLASRPQTEARNQGQHSFKLIRHGYIAKAKAKHQKALEALSHQKPKGLKGLGLRKPKAPNAKGLQKPKGSNILRAPNAPGLQKP